MASDRVVIPADRNQAGSRPASWPHSGRGEKRPQTARARASNHPLDLPPALQGRGQSREGRRWRDLAAAYAKQLGPERLRREDVVARFRNLIWLSLEIERLRDERLSDKPVPIHTVLHMVQEQRVLLAELSLNELDPDAAAPNLQEYLHTRHAAPAEADK